jgi:hypothetical protein
MWVKTHLHMGRNRQPVFTPEHTILRFFQAPESLNRLTLKVKVFEVDVEAGNPGTYRCGVGSNARLLANQQLDFVSAAFGRRWTEVCIYTSREAFLENASSCKPHALCLQAEWWKGLSGGFGNLPSRVLPRSFGPRTPRNSKPPCCRRIDQRGFGVVEDESAELPSSQQVPSCANSIAPCTRSCEFSTCLSSVRCKIERAPVHCGADLLS